MLGLVVVFGAGSCFGAWFLGAAAEERGVFLKENAAAGAGELLDEAGGGEEADEGEGGR